LAYNCRQGSGKTHQCCDVWIRMVRNGNVLSPRWIRIQPKLKPVLRIRDVYPGSDFFPYRIRIFSIPDPNFSHPGSTGSGKTHQCCDVWIRMVRNGNVFSPRWIRILPKLKLRQVNKYNKSLRIITDLDLGVRKQCCGSVTSWYESGSVLYVLFCL
jgi:hypothetical protein